MTKLSVSWILVAILFAPGARAEISLQNGEVVIDASGTDGYYSGEDGTSGGNVQLHLAYTDATKTVVALTGSSTKGGRTTPIAQQFAIKDLKRIILRARGGDGANGSNGGDGSNGSNGYDGNNGSDGWNGSDGSAGSSGSDGCPPGSGSNGGNGSDGGDGGNGGDGTNASDGGDGGDGGNGGNGGNAGSVVVSTAPDQSELMLLAQVDVRKGEGGSGGRGGSGGGGGRGGSGGRGGNGGSGGRGGPGGSGGRNTCTNDKGEFIGGPDGSSGYSGSDGRSGNAGRNGSDGASGSNGRDGSSGYNGSDGSTGSQSYQLASPNGTQSFAAPFHLEIGSATFIDDNEDGILEPGERAHLMAIQLKNTGPMPSPAGQKIQLSLLPSSNLLAPGPLTATFPEIAAGAQSGVLQFHKGQLMLQAPDRQSLIGQKTAVGLVFGINGVQTYDDLDTGMSIGWPIALSTGTQKASGNFSIPQQVSFTLRNLGKQELGPRGSQRFEVAFDWSSKTIPASDVNVVLADGRTFNLASPAEINNLTVPASSNTPLALQLLVRDSKLAASGAGTLNVTLKLQDASGPDEEALQKIPVAVNLTLDTNAIPWAQEIQLRDAKISCNFYKLAKPALEKITSIMVQKDKGSNQLTVKVGAAALLSPAMVMPATAMLPYYEQFQGKWTAQLAIDFLNKLVSPGSPKNGPWAFKGCAIVP